MDSTLYKDFATSRGFTYHYYYSPAKDRQPTLLLSHGFPSSSYDWHALIEALQPYGYGLLAPDQLGYGGTDKPEEAEAYKPSLIARDIVDILENEGLKRVIAVGHDWGSAVTSRLYNFFPERVSAAVFLALSYMAPAPSLDIHAIRAINERTRRDLGYEIIGYWLFLSEQDSHKIIENHLQSFLSILFAKDKKMSTPHFAGIDGLKKWLLADKMVLRADYMPDEELKNFSEPLRTHGFKGPKNWYRIKVSGIAANDESNIPEDRYVVKVPVFFGAALGDYICFADQGKATTAKFCSDSDTVVREYNGDHWIIFSHSKAIANDLHPWIEGLKAKNRI